MRPTRRPRCHSASNRGPRLFLGNLKIRGVADDALVRIAAFCLTRLPERGCGPWAVGMPHPSSCFPDMARSSTLRPPKGFPPPHENRPAKSLKPDLLKGGEPHQFLFRSQAAGKPEQRPDDEMQSPHRRRGSTAPLSSFEAKGRNIGNRHELPRRHSQSLEVPP
jgi:hypothetical protein